MSSADIAPPLTGTSDRPRGIGRAPGVSFASRLGLGQKAACYALAILLTILVIYPVGVLIVSSFMTGQPGRWGTFSLAGYRVWLNAGDMLPIVANSVIYAGARLVISLSFAVLFAWAVARTNVPYPRLISLLVPIPFFIPDLLTGMSWLMLGNPQNGLINQLATYLFGTKGPIINLYGWTGLIFHSSLSTIAFIFLMIVGFFEKMDASYEEAAVTLGANKYMALFTITLPMLAPALLGVSILVFVHGLESFESPLLFGNPGGVYVFSNEIYRMLSYRHPPQYSAATALSVLVIVIMVALLTVQSKLIGNRQYAVVTGKGYCPSKIKLPNVARWIIFGLFALYFFLAVVLPVVQIVASSFFRIFGLYNLSGLTLQNWQNLVNDDQAVSGIVNTILYSSIAGVLTVLIGGAVGYIKVRTSNWLAGYLEFAAWLPWTLPGIVLGLALLWAWALPPSPFNLYGTASVIIIGFIIKGLPLGTSTMQSSIRQIGKELEESSRVHGGTWLRTVAHVLGPLVRQGALATFVIVFALAARDLTIPLLLYRGGTETLTVALLHYYEEGIMGALSAIAVVQLAMVMSLVILERLLSRRPADL